MMEEPVAASSTPAKKTARKAPTPARARGKTPATRTAVQPQEVEERAVAAAAPAARPRRASQVAAAAMRGEVEPAVSVAVEPEPDAAPAEPGAIPEDMIAELPFHGRTIRVKIPTPEQLTIYRRLSRQFQDVSANDAEMDIDVALRHLDRAVRLVQSILADQHDREWIEDQLLEGGLTLEDCTAILREAFAALRRKSEEQTAPNRADRRAAGRSGSRARLED